MDNERYVVPFRVGNELTAESFRLSTSRDTSRLAAPRYQSFYSSFVRPRIAMYRGWIENYHNIERSFMPTLFLQKIGNGIVSTLFNKPFVLNSNNDETNAITKTKYNKVKFFENTKKAYSFGLEGGAGLIKWNRDYENNLRIEAIPMDSFFIETDAYGDIERVKSFIAVYHDTISSTYEYGLCEERFFKYVTKNGETIRYPMVHYIIYRTSSNITSDTKPDSNNIVAWGDLPYDVRQLIKKDYGEIFIDGYEGKDLQNYEKCKLLPFDDDLGCRMLKFTEYIPEFPTLPFGQPLADLLMNENYAYDQLKYFERLEVYISRARIMLDKRYENPNDPDGAKNALDPLVFTYYDSMIGESDDKKPQALQPELRSDAINRQKQNILNDVAFSLNLSSTTIASWLSDGQTQKTATEIEYERTKTSAFIEDKLGIITRPLQDMIDIYYHYYGVEAPELNIIPEVQTVRSENIRLFSELFDKGQVDSKMLAKEILGACSAKELDDLSNFIEANKQKAVPGGVPMVPGVENGGLVWKLKKN